MSTRYSSPFHCCRTDFYDVRTFATIDCTTLFVCTDIDRYNACDEAVSNNKTRSKKKSIGYASSFEFYILYFV